MSLLKVSKTLLEVETSNSTPSGRPSTTPTLSAVAPLTQFVPGMRALVVPRTHAHGRWAAALREPSPLGPRGSGLEKVKEVLAL